MRYNDIKEYRLAVDLPERTFPKFSKKDLIGQISINTGDFNIFKKEIKDLIYIVTGTSHKNGDLNSWVILRKIKNYLMAVHAETTQPKNKIISNLFMNLKKLLDKPIISDFSLTFSGEKLWQSFEKNYPEDLKILSADTDEIFLLNDVGKIKNKNNELVKHPKNDINDDVNQNWFYILENSLGKINKFGVIITESDNFFRYVYF